MAYSHSADCVSAKMTAYNAPSPNVVTESNYSGSNRGWKAFKQLDSGDPWWYNSGATPQWIKYDFGSGNATVVDAYTFCSTPNNASYPGMPRSWKLEGSNDDSNWTMLDYQTTVLGWGSNNQRYFAFPNTTAYRYYKFTFFTKEGSSWQIDEIELLNDGNTWGGYVHSENCVSPKMTGASAPSPYVVTDSNHLAPNPGWLVFDQTFCADPWAANSGNPSEWIKIDMGEATDIDGYSLTAPTNESDYPAMPGSWTLAGSNNDSDWTTLDTRSLVTWSSDQMRTYELGGVASYRYYRFTFTAKPAGPTWTVGEIELTKTPAEPAGGADWWPFFLRYLNEN